MPNRNGTINGGEYRYGYQGSEKDDEIKGEGNSYTTHFRQLDVRVARWLSIDPKATPWESPYVSMGNNPILMNDPFGDTVRLDKDGFDRWNSSLQSIGITDSPFSFNEKQGTISFDSNFDRSLYNDKQLEVIDNLAIAVNSIVDVNIYFITQDTKIEDYTDESGNPMTPRQANIDGTTLTYRNEDNSVDKISVYIVTDPTYMKPTSVPYGNGWRTIYIESPYSYARPNLALLHEVGGHAALHLTQTSLTRAQHNKKTEDFETMFRSIFIVGYYTEKSAKKHNRKAKRGGGTFVKAGDPIFLNGAATVH